MNKATIKTQETFFIRGRLCPASSRNQERKRAKLFSETVFNVENVGNAMAEGFKAFGNQRRKEEEPQGGPRPAVPSRLLAFCVLDRARESEIKEATQSLM